MQRSQKATQSRDSAFTPTPNAKRGDGWYYYCKDCNNKRSKSRYIGTDPFGISPNSIASRLSRLTLSERLKYYKNRRQYEEDKRALESWGAKGFSAGGLDTEGESYDK